MEIEHPSPQEIANNIHDRDWRLNNLYYITNKQKQKVLFTPNKVQEILQASPDRLKAVLKARQLGISTERLIYYLDKACFNENRTVCILAHEQDSIKKLFRIVRYAYDNMPELCRPRISKGGGSMYELYFPGVNSRIYCDLESRSDTISDLHISEYAFVRSPEKVLATMDAVPIQTGEISIESTPNGMNHFYDDWIDEHWPFKKFFFPWYFDPEYALETPDIQFTKDEKNLIKKAKEAYDIDITKEQIAFRRFKIRQKKNLDHFVQEYPEDETSCFLMSGIAVLDLKQIAALKEKAPAPLSDDGELRVWEEYDRTKQYVIGCDTAEGVGKDFSVAVVIDVKARKVVAQLRGQLRASLFADKIFDLACQYTAKRRPWPLISVERNNHGHAVILALEEIHEYSNLYEHTDDRYGWRTDSVTRPIMINGFIDAISNGSFKIYDKDTLSECMTLVDNNGKIEAMSGKHDDCIMATAIAIQMVIGPYDAFEFTQSILTE